MKTITFDETKWQLVPKHPTDEMIAAAYVLGEASAEGIDEMWADMLAAAPAKQENTPLQKKVAEELKPLREAIENSTGKWERT